MMDSRDGQTYKTVTIGSQTWMAENLNYETENSYCNDGKSYNCTKYGRLYTWATAVGKSEDDCGYGRACSLPSGKIQGICPTGWHLPSESEWNALFDAVGGSLTAGEQLKSTSGWNCDGNGSDAFSFSALPVGYRYLDGSYGNDTYFAYFWGSTEDGIMYLSSTSVSAFWGISAAFMDGRIKFYWFSVRCLKD